jgi:hypothetical protein
MPVDLTFAEEEIQKLFGHEAAEDEDPARLREYYFKTSVFEQVAADLPLRVLVGHKGIGKSALFQVAMHEDRQRNRVAILIKPDDISGLATDTSDFLKTIRYWKVGLLEIVARKVLTSLGGDAGDVQAQLTKAGGRLIEFLRGTFADVHNLNLAPANIAIVRRFLES